MATATKQFQIGPRLVLAGDEIPPGADLAELRAAGLVVEEAESPAPAEPQPAPKRRRKRAAGG